MKMHTHRRTTRLGAIPDPTGTTFTVWAPDPTAVSVAVEDRSPLLLRRDEHGYHTAHVAGALPGERYWFVLDGERRPDPASAFQPDGPLGPSQIVDHAAFRWTDAGWPGISAPHAQVIYELHLGTFTPEGTWLAAQRELPRLRDIGVTTIEVMPVADFPGRFGWGYDGVDLFAPSRLYGTPDSAKSFVDEAHRLGLAVILDVVYNHLGPSGNFLREYAKAYFCDRATEWGEAINFDGDASEHVRRFFVENAAYWIEHFHFDGLRLDAIHAIEDSSPTHIVSAVAAAARAAAGGRQIFLVGEHEAQEVDRLAGPGREPDGMDALWNDDWHHAAVVRLNGRRHAYFTDYLGSAQEFAAMAAYGFLYQGQWYVWQKKRRGTDSRRRPGACFVSFLDNHDQVANTGLGWRSNHMADSGTWRALTGLLLLGPHVPMLFQGQEYASERRFYYFADHEAPLSDAIRDGRADFLAQFPGMATPEMRERLPVPSEPSTFEASKLDPTERDRRAWAQLLHQDLITRRRTQPLLSRLGTAEVTVDTCVLSADVVVLRYSAPHADDVLLIVNLGPDHALPVMNHPLLAPPPTRRWTLSWSSDSPRYDGPGVAHFETTFPWVLPARSCSLMELMPEDALV